jgi:endogenous inhibitor of DNA gyrase (YacG/DUF329 family)
MQVEVRCPQCDRTFEPNKRWQRFCSHRCKTAHWYALNADAHKAKRRARHAAKADARRTEQAGLAGAASRSAVGMDDHKGRVFNASTGLQIERPAARSTHAVGVIASIRKGNDTPPTPPRGGVGSLGRLGNAGKAPPPGINVFGLAKTLVPLRRWTGRPA